MANKPSNIINLGRHSKSQSKELDNDRQRGSYVPAAEKPVALAMPKLPGLKQLPSPVVECFDFYSKALFKLLGQFFNEADDLLFQQASNSANNLAQSSFFEAMRSLRLERGAIAQQLLLEAHKSFKALPTAVNLTQQNSSIYDQELYLDNVSLVQNDALEEEVAINTMVNRCLNNQQDILEQVLRRFCELLGRPHQELAIEHLAMHPEALCKKLVQQLTSLSLTIKTKLMLLKLFEKAVLSCIPELSHAINTRLTQRGVLPDLQEQIRQEKRQQRLNKRANGGLTQAAGISSQGLQQLLASVDTASESLASFNSATDPALPILDSGHLSLLLNQVQQQGLGQASLQGQGLMGFLQPVLAQHGQVSQLNQKMINLVNMLFEYIWEDPNLAEPMRSLLSRMQIPLLKVALVDDSFFGSGSHPARKLLNEMARAALSWAEPENFDSNAEKHDPLYHLLNSIVQRVLNEFDQDVGLFSVLLQQLQDFIRKEQRRAQLIAQRTVDKAKGEAKSEQARQTAHQALDRLLERYPCPRSLIDLMHQAWARCLHLALLKHGQSSLVWQQQQQLAESICACVQKLTQAQGAKPKSDLQRLGQLLGAMRKQLDDVGYDEYQLRPLFNRLVEDCKRRVPEPGAAIKAPEADQPKVDKAIVTQKAETGDVAHEREATRAKAVAQNNHSVDERYIQQAKALKQGAWLEFTESGSKRRCRLAAVVSDLGRYIFVDRLGKKLLELDIESLAADLQRGNLRVLDEGMLFDRALEAVIGDLRQSRKSREQRLGPQT